MSRKHATMYHVASTPAEGQFMYKTHVALMAYCNSCSARVTHHIIANILMNISA